jgi:hypothetical protein
MEKCLVTLAAAPLDSGILNRVARYFGWDVLHVRSLASLEPIDSSRIAAILFDREAAGHTWLDAASSLRRMKPGVRLVACHGFFEPVPWPELAAAGVFHALRVPLIESEVHQSLGLSGPRTGSGESVRTPCAPRHNPLTLGIPASPECAFSRDSAPF